MGAACSYNQRLKPSTRSARFPDATFANCNRLLALGRTPNGRSVADSSGSMNRGCQHI